MKTFRGSFWITFLRSLGFFFILIFLGAILLLVRSFQLYDLAAGGLFGSISGLELVLFSLSGAVAILSFVLAKVLYLLGKIAHSLEYPGGLSSKAHPGH